MPTRKPQPGTLLLGCQILDTAPENTVTRQRQRQMPLHPQLPTKKIATYWQMQSKSDALVVERQIKKLVKREKQALIDQFQNSANNQTHCITSK